MASLQERNGSYRVIFRHQGRQYFVTIGVVSPQEAEAKSAQVSYLVMRIKQGLIELPPASVLPSLLSTTANCQVVPSCPAEDASPSALGRSATTSWRPRRRAGRKARSTHGHPLQAHGRHAW
jgi:hypothetical protein